RLDWQKGYQSQKKEYNYLIDEITGKIPLELEGTLFRNGPGLLDINGMPIQHPFDGDGMICSIAFKSGKAYFCNRFIRTAGYLAEQAAGKILYRGVFGTQKPGGLLANLFDIKLKNIANTNVIYWGDKLLALWEAAEPHRLDPRTLETIGLDYLDGILQPGDAFAAHPRIDPSCELDKGEPCLVNFSLQPGLSSKINLYEISPTGKLLRNHSHIVPGFSFIHDFAITPNYAIFCQNPVSFNPLPFLFGLKGAGECVKFQPAKPTKIILIPRQPPYAKTEIKIFQVQSGFIFHHVNAFEQDNKVYLESVAYASLPEVEAKTDFRETDFNALSPGQLWQVSLDLATNQANSQLINHRCVEFPSINPQQVGRDYRYIFIGAAHNPTGNAPLQAILKIDRQTGEEKIYSFAPQGFISEPIFVPHPQAKQEDQGWVLTLVYDAAKHRSKVVILDGENLTAIASLQLKHHIPYGLHGSWCEQVFAEF
ncbi:MAG: Apocarotenoid-15,15'-oxygenase, partial [Cyanobacteria bacterium J083]